LAYELMYVMKCLKEMKDKVLYLPEMICAYGVFKDRLEAGRKLAQVIRKYIGDEVENCLIMAIPRGGVPVACAIAEELELPVDLIVCRKIQVPYNPEAGYGAVAPDGTVVLNEVLVHELGLTDEQVDEGVRKTMEEIKRREKVLRGGRPYPSLQGKLVLLVDDGLATGYTMLAAIRFVKNRGARRVVVAVPTAPPSALRLIADEVDKVICLNVRGDLFGFAVADAYHVWYDLDDEEVLMYLKKVWRRGLRP